MIRSLAIRVGMLGVLAATAGAWAAEPVSGGSMNPSTNPPAVVARPLAVTPGQFEALCRLEAEPEHMAVLQVTASYTEEEASAREKHLQFVRASDDFWSVAYHIGWPGAYLAILLCAL